jgi:hypothetical protein
MRPVSTRLKTLKCPPSFDARATHSMPESNFLAGANFELLMMGKEVRNRTREGGYWSVAQLAGLAALKALFGGLWRAFFRVFKTSG